MPGCATWLGTGQAPSRGCTCLQKHNPRGWFSSPTPPNQKYFIPSPPHCQDARREQSHILTSSQGCTPAAAPISGVAWCRTAFSGVGARVLQLPVIGCYFAQRGRQLLLYIILASPRQPAGEGKVAALRPEVWFCVDFHPFNQTGEQFVAQHRGTWCCSSNWHAGGHGACPDAAVRVCTGKGGQARGYFWQFL